MSARYVSRASGSGQRREHTAMRDARRFADHDARAWDPRVTRLYWTRGGDGVLYGYATRAHLYADSTGDRPDLIRATIDRVSSSEE